MEGKSKKLTGKNGIVAKITKESNAHKFTIQWDTRGTSIESARGISKAGGMPAKPPCKKQKHTPVLRAIQRDLTVIRMMSPVLVIQRKKEVTVRNKEGYQEAGAQYWSTHGREWVEIDHLTVDPAVNAYTGITKLKWIFSGRC